MKNLYLVLPREINVLKIRASEEVIKIIKLMLNEADKVSASDEIIGQADIINIYNN